MVGLKEVFTNKIFLITFLVTLLSTLFIEFRLINLIGYFAGLLFVFLFYAYFGFDDEKRIKRIIWSILFFIIITIVGLFLVKLIFGKTLLLFDKTSRIFYDILIQSIITIIMVIGISTFICLIREIGTIIVRKIRTILKQ
ncbi:hypothetical protein HQ529_06640 [Candidatus Woesearchaeota archaeon]|nr:hypothetical protein [Candidatus Woesearchaeota archaeon]